MRRVPDVVVIVDANYESTAVQEALRLEIPVIAIVDTNTDPTIVSHVIPANDDSIRTIQLIISALSDTILSAQVKEADKTEDGGKSEIEIQPVAQSEDEDKKEELKTDDTTEADEEIGDEEKGSEEEISVEENSEDSDNVLIDVEVADEPEGDKEEPKKDHETESD